MGNDVQNAESFESVKNRLSEIADTVADENLSLDDALDLYEEAVSLGLKASDLLEVGIGLPDEEVATEAESDVASASEGSSVAENTPTERA